MVQCQAKYNSPAAKKASDEDANGLESMILLAEGAHIMIIHNLWTTKGTVFCLVFKLVFQFNLLCMVRKLVRVGSWSLCSVS